MREPKKEPKTAKNAISKPIRKSINPFEENKIIAAMFVETFTIFEIADELRKDNPKI